MSSPWKQQGVGQRGYRRRIAGPALLYQQLMVTPSPLGPRKHHHLMLQIVSGVRGGVAVHRRIDLERKQRIMRRKRMSTMKGKKGIMKRKKRQTRHLGKVYVHQGERDACLRLWRVQGVMLRIRWLLQEVVEADNGMPIIIKRRQEIQHQSLVQKEGRSRKGTVRRNDLAMMNIQTKKKRVIMRRKMRMVKTMRVIILTEGTGRRSRTRPKRAKEVYSHHPEAHGEKVVRRPEVGGQGEQGKLAFMGLVSRSPM